MPAPLWSPSAERIAASRMEAFRRFVNQRHALGLVDYPALHAWSVQRREAFWQAIVDFFEVRFQQPPRAVLEEGAQMPSARWFPGATLNFAEHLLRRRDDAPALIAVSEDGRREVLSHAELARHVAGLQKRLAALGIGPGDRVAALMPNTWQTVVGMLATASLGATWSSCSPDFGTQGVIDRFGQIEPRVLIACAGYRYAGKSLDLTAKLKFHEYFGFSIHRFNTPVENKTKLLQLDVTNVLKHKEFLKWLYAEIDWSFPLTVSHVIHADDNASKALAKIVVKRLRTRLAIKSSVKVIPYNKLEEKNCKDATGVVIVSTVARDGGVLREISRDLRSYIKADIPRHFLSPIGIPQTNESWSQLRMFLVRNSTPREYGFANWIQLPLGEDSDDNSWHRLITAYERHSNQNLHELELGHLQDTSNILASLELAGNAASEAFTGFLLSPRGSELRLSEGFLFFGDKTDIAKRYAKVEPSMVYLTMSAVLQNAREHRDHERRLCPNGYESVVLAPECFLRFNEAILQACMLRACHPAELDYSSSPELSKVMKELLVKVFARWDKDFGDAALEFAAAIAVGSLRLAKRDMETLLDDALEQHAGKQSALLGMLVLAKQATRMTC